MNKKGDVGRVVGFVVFLLLLSLSTPARAQRIYVLAPPGDPNVTSITSALTSDGLTVVRSSVADNAWTGAELTNGSYAAILHLGNSSTSSTSLLPSASAAITSFVQSGGGYVTDALTARRYDASSADAMTAVVPAYVASTVSTGSYSLTTRSPVTKAHAAIVGGFDRAGSYTHTHFNLGRRAGTDMYVAYDAGSNAQVLVGGSYGSGLTMVVGYGADALAYSSFRVLVTRPVRWAAKSPRVVAQDLSAATNLGNSLTFTMSVNVYTGSPTLNWARIPTPSSGTVTGTYPTITYTATTLESEAGTQYLDFLVSNDVSADVLTITIIVIRPGRPPTAGSFSVTTPEDIPATITLQGADPTNDPLTYSIVTSPTRGTLSGSGNTRTYTPATNLSGSDFFTYRVTDNQGLSAEGTVLINIAAVNDPPVAGPNLTFTTRANVPVTFQPAVSDIDSPGTIAQFGTVPWGMLEMVGTSWRYTPDPARLGPVVLAWRGFDGSSFSEDRTVTINVLPVASIVAQSQDVTLDEDALVTINLTATDQQGRGLTYRIVNPPAAGTGSLQGTPPEVRYQGPPSWSGTARFTFDACAGSECSDPATVNLTIRPVDDPPVALDRSANTNEEVPVTVALGGSDPEGRPVTFALERPPTRGTAVISGNSVTFTPALDLTGPATFTYTAFDGAVRSSPAVVTVEVRNVNDGPVALPVAFTAARFATTLVPLLASDVDDAPSTLVFEVASSPAHGVLSGAPPSLQYRADDSYEGPDSFTFVAVDPAGARSAPGTVSITVGGGGLPPVATPQVLSLDEDSTSYFTLTGVDPEGAPLVVELVSMPETGTFSFLAPNGAFRPRANSTLSEAFQFRVSDGVSWSAPALVTFNIRPVNDPPVVRGPGQVTLTEDTPVEITVDVADIDSATPRIVVDTPPSRGALSAVAGAPNRLLFTPTRNLNGPDRFTVQASDGSLASEPYTILLSILPVDDPPAATPQQRTTAEDTALPLLLTGSDPDGDSLTFRVEGPPGHGTLTGTPPSLNYLPARDYAGPDQFAFTVSDGTTRTAPVLVRIDVTAVNDPPALADRTLAMAEDGALVLSRVAGTLPGFDVEGDPLTYQLEAPSVGNVLVRSANVFEYSPPADYNGAATIRFRAGDGRLFSPYSVLTIDVTPVNDPPAFVAPLPPPTRTVPDGGPLEFTLAARDVDGDPLRFTATGLPSGATLAAGTGLFRWTPAYEQAGRHTVAFRVTDGTGAFEERSVELVVTVADRDGDGVPDAVEQRFGTLPDRPDTDGDGLDDLTELGSLVTPFDADRDTIRDALDADSDNDGVLDTNERGPDGKQVDSDGDGTPDQRDADSDDDGIEDRVDNCRVVPNPFQVNQDADGEGDACDPDRDGDGVSNTRETTLGMNADAADSDGDGISDGDEVGPTNFASDVDRDGAADAIELDSDNDGVPDSVEAGDEELRTTPVDSDADGEADYRDLDSDNDGVPDGTDRCRLVTDPQQGDLDGDGEGDACDGDEDGDGVPDRADTCPRLADPLQEDADEDGVGDACTADDDGDALLDDVDNCPGVANADQLDFDRDGVGEACDPTFDAVPVGGCDAGGAGWLGLLGLWGLVRRRRARWAGRR